MQIEAPLFRKHEEQGRAIVGDTCNACTLVFRGFSLRLGYSTKQGDYREQIKYDDVCRRRSFAAAAGCRAVVPGGTMDIEHSFSRGKVPAKACDGHCDQAMRIGSCPDNMGSTNLRVILLALVWDAPATSVSEFVEPLGWLVSSGGVTACRGNQEFSKVEW